ncbi:MAG TPA: response regulator [Nostocaceae cyanobacterium]|nr:response regulator [Nostocaceae cyanobacterium]
MYLAHSCMSNEKKDSSQQPLILVVEDHEDSLLLISYALELLGCGFICQKDSSSTLLVAKEYQPDLIMLDILLPSLSGLDVVRSLKQEPLTCKIPVVAVTALTGEEEQKNILATGFDDYISKPYMLEDLETMIYRFLNPKFGSKLAFETCQE